ncbi:MAG TPA: MFS transporter [Bryobacteraceae bacterium]|nr:MFS transporter [Bryobacteraceae bacterium]
MGLFPTGFGTRFWVLIAATFLGFLGEGTVLPVLGPHVRHDLGGSDQTVGLAIGIFSFVSLAARFLSGPLADRRGRKVSFLAGLLSCALAGSACLLPFGLPGIYLGRMLQGFGEAFLYTGAAAWAVETAGVKRSGQALGYVSCGIWGGTAAGPLVGQWLGSFDRAAAMQIVASLIAFGLVMRVAEEYKPMPREGHRTWLSGRLIASGLAVGFVNVHYPVVAGFLILHLARHGNSGPAAYTAYASVILLSRFFLGGLPDRIRPAITFYGGLGLMTIGLLLLAPGPSPAVAVSAGAVLGLGMSFPWSSIASTVVRRASASDRGSALGVLTGFFDLFVGVSSLGAGAVAARFGYTMAFWMGAMSLGAAALAGWYVFAPEKVKERAYAAAVVGADAATEG